MKAFQTVRPCITPPNPAKTFRRTDKQAIAFEAFVARPYFHGSRGAYETIQAVEWACVINGLAAYQVRK